MRLPTLAALLVVLTACPPPGSVAPPPKPPSGPTLADDIKSLTVPVPDAAAAGIEAALRRLAKRADSGHIEAAWARAHYLIDLFDDARFRRDDASLALLHRALGRSGDPARGSKATDAALSGLLREVDRVLAIDRLHPHAQAARTVVEFDSRPPVTRVGLLRRMAELKAVARGKSPLAENARLRLVGYCTQALGHVAEARFAERMRVLAHCLYPLYDSDPEPYFAENPELRPPPPGWRALVARAETLLDRIAASSSRVAGAGAHRKTMLRELVATSAGEMPRLPDAKKLGVPRSERALPYDWTPMLSLGRGESLGVLAKLDVITRSVQGDGRRTLAVALAADAGAVVLFQVAEAARSAGADRLELAVTVTQKLVVPPGDYWAGQLSDGKVERLGVLDLALAPLGGTAEKRTSRWNPARAGLGLHLEVGANTWRLLSPTGEVATIAATSRGDSATAELRRALAEIYSAFPDEDAVVLVPLEGATLAGFVRALEAARHDAQGRELMTQIGLGKRGPAPRKNVLKRRIARRAGAVVEIEPTALAVRTPVVRRCYQDLLEKKPRRAGRFRLELARDAVTVTEGPRDKALRDCVSGGVAEMMKAEKMASAVVELKAE